jgi:CO dehydrogenase maturation factor
MKLAISGKGGVGKTTLAALLAQTYADNGRDVLAVDADPSPCLAGALGFPADLQERLHPIAEMDALIEERTGAKPGTSGGFFTLNPRVDDIPERFTVSNRGVRLLEMGSVETGGSGCICPESAMLKTLFTHLFFRRDDVLILDMYAGVEHLGRAKKLWLVGNKVEDRDEAAFLENESPGLPLLGIIPADSAVLQADRLGLSVYDHVPQIKKAAEKIAFEISEHA